MLRRVHAGLGADHDIAFDGCHVLADDLRHDPRDVIDVPTTLGGTFQPADEIHDHLVAWHELAWHGVRIAGPPIAQLEVWTDPAALRGFTVHNLDTYWRASAEALTAMPFEANAPDSCTWCVLGVTRLHHLLVTDEMTTKSRAGHWGLSHYPERFHRVLSEALRVREGGDDQYPDDPDQRGHDTTDFLAYVVAEGTR